MGSCPETSNDVKILNNTQTINVSVATYMQALVAVIIYDLRKTWFVLICFLNKTFREIGQ